VGRDRPLLVFVSDIHLTDELHGAAISRADQFERFWIRIQAARGHRPAELCFVGDLFDLVRSPSWLTAKPRPYHRVDDGVRAHVEGIVDRVLEREAAFFAALRRRVEEGALRIHYVLGNHDRLLGRCPAARRKIWRALTGEDRDIDFQNEAVFRDHKVLAYHGHFGDPINYNPEGGGTAGDAIGLELIVRFPQAVRRRLEVDHPQLDDIDDVRPIYAVPAWVRQLGVFRRELLQPVENTWSALVEDFLSNPFIRTWMRREHRVLGFDTGKKLRLLLELSTGKMLARGHDQRLTKLYRLFQHGFDGKMAEKAALELAKPERRGLRYVVNGHSHFSSIVPLGSIEGEPAVYFNTGTWRTVHQIGHTIRGRPSFLPYDAMTYLVFFPDTDEMGRDYEWWTGALVAQKGPAD
jgi:UDP-2,3-diacylglucosamine pyrophosphatase LpxH